MTYLKAAYPASSNYSLALLNKRCRYPTPSGVFETSRQIHGGEDFVHHICPLLQPANFLSHQLLLAHLIGCHRLVDVHRHQCGKQLLLPGDEGVGHRSRLDHRRPPDAGEGLHLWDALVVDEVVVLLCIC